MNLFGISWKNIRVKPLSTLLSLILFVLGVGLISLLLLVNKQMTDKFEKSHGGVNLVVGAKGSPLQLILSSIYHIDFPTGNISLEEARPFLNPKHPLIEKTVPMSLGDSYSGYRIVGTTHEYLDVYAAEVDEGKLFKNNFEATLGARVAEELGLDIGDQFASAHGFGDSHMHHDEHPFTVVSILKPSGTVLDQLILSNLSSIWVSHAPHDESETATGTSEEDHSDHDHGDGHNHDHDHEHGDHDHSEHDHDHGENDHGEHDHSEHDHDHGEHDHGDHDHAHHDHGHSEPGIYTTNDLFEAIPENEEKEITSMLIFYKSETDFRALNMGRGINDNTDMQSANPVYQTARLFEMMGVGERALRALALIIVIVSGLSVFISLFSSLKERRYELAIMRVMGASRSKLFLLVIIEGLIIAILGFLIGIGVSHFAMEVLARYMQDAYQYSFTGMMFLKEELILLGGALIVGFIAALIPAIQASKTDISETLSTN
ncbi:MAG: FtsX-like permease family protein [Bacteroidota bacterium]